MKYIHNPVTNTLDKTDDMEIQVKRTTENNKNPGSFQRLVKEDEKIAKQVRDYAPHKIDVEKTLEKYEDDYVSKRGQQTIAITDTANKHLRNEIKKGNLKKEDLLLEQDKNGLMVNKNRTIAMRDSFMAKQFNRALGVNGEPQATPEQVGKLAERLERNAQMTGGKGPFTKIADNLGKKPIPKKPIKPYEFPEFKIDPTTINYKPHTPDPEFLRQERNFNRMVEESNKPKGLPGILGLNKSDYE
tara:strand:+ start:220 stop:951 length:732 start_codon:yes stop_codon:yes gene_type:complete